MAGKLVKSLLWDPAPLQGGGPNILPDPAPLQGGGPNILPDFPLSTWDKHSCTLV